MAASAFPIPHGMKAVRAQFGNFNFTELSGANVDVDDTWEADNLVMLRNVAGTGLNVRLHRLVAPEFEAALKEIVAACPKYKIRMLGGYCPRHKMHDVKRELSTHSWGIAFDLNWDKNPVAATLITDFPPELIAILKRRGWNWGGDWKGTKDSMHWQWATGC